MSMFAKYYQTKSVCYDSDYEENDFQPPDEDDEPDTLDESVPSKFMFSKKSKIVFEEIDHEEYFDAITEDSKYEGKFESDKNPTKTVKCTCGWFCELPESHIEHSKWSGCDYISSKYDLSYDSDGEIHGTLKPSEGKKPTKKIVKKQPKDGQFNICGYRGEDPKKCVCSNCTTRRISSKSLCQTHHDEYLAMWSSSDNGYLATKLNTTYEEKEFVKSKGALWSQKLKCWYVKLSNPNYMELVNGKLECPNLGPQHCPINGHCGYCD